MQTIIINATVHTGTEVLKNQTITIQNGVISLATHKPDAKILTFNISIFQQDLLMPISMVVNNAILPKMLPKKLSKIFMNQA